MPPHRFFAIALTTVVALAGCASGSNPTTVEALPPAAAVALLEEPGLVVLDVRTPDEFASGHLAGATNIDVSAPTFDEQVLTIPLDEPVLVYCRSGNRSGVASERMAALGFTRLYNSGGGLADLAAAGAAVTP